MHNESVVAVRGFPLPLEDPGKPAPMLLLLSCLLPSSSALCPATGFSSLDLKCGALFTTRNKDVVFDMGLGVQLDDLWP